MRIPLLLALVPLAAPAPARAAEIGNAVSIERQVTGVLSGRNSTLSPGDALAQNELIATGAGSSAQLRFLDQTQLMIGPVSSVKLDTFVYNPDKTARAIVIDLARGGFRFVSGGSGDEAYVIRTPHAVIGVRGTVFGIVVARDRTIITLKSGAVQACPRAGRGQGCVTATRPEDAIVVTRSTALPPAPRIPGQQPDFTEWCKGRAQCGL